MATKKIYIVHPTKNFAAALKKTLDEYVARLESKDFEVYYPIRDTDQEDETGYMICADNAFGISEAEEVHFFWTKENESCMFDLGVAFAYNKPLVIINPEDIEPQEGVCTANMICYWSFDSEEENASE